MHIYLYIYIHFKYFKSKFSKIEKEYMCIQRKLITKSWLQNLKENLQTIDI